MSTASVDTSFNTSDDPLGEPYSVAVDQSGNAYVADVLTAGIDKFNASTGAQEAFGNTKDSISPNAVTTYGSTIYIAGAPNTKVVELNNDGSASTGSSTASDLTNPALLALADPTHLFETVTDSTKIVERNPSNSSVYTGFSVTADNLTDIGGIAADNAGHLFVTESCPANEIVELDASTGAVINTFSASTAGGITCPRAVAVDNAGHVFVVGLSSTNDAEVVELSATDGSVVSSFDAQTVSGGLNVGGSIAVTSDDEVFLIGGDGLVRVDPTSAVPPAAPVISAVVPGDTSATVTWTPGRDGGNAVISYTATAAPGGAHCTVAPPTVSCTIKGLATDSTYDVTVTATNGIGTSAPSESMSVTTSNYTLTLNPHGDGSIFSPAGINCPNSGCDPVYPAGTSLTLSAFANPGSYFSGWADACSGSASCTLTMTAPRTVAANFTKGDADTVVFTYDNPNAGTGSGSLIINGESCNAQCSQFGFGYQAGSTMTVVARPDSGSSFTGWSGGPCDGTTGTCTFTLTGTTEMDADFTAGTPPVQVPVTVSIAGAGTGVVTGPGIDCPTTCTHAYTAGTSVALVAAPASDSTFKGWTGACSGTATCTIAPSAAATVTATFAKIPAPSTRLVSMTVHPTKGSAKFVFTKSGDATGFRCALTRAGAKVHYSSCASPKSYLRLARGRYDFRVRAVGPGGDDPTPVSRTFTIKKH